MKEKQYYYLTTNFMPNYEKTKFEKVSDDVFVLKNGDKYKKRLLYDWGWGQEFGFEILPKPSFETLIEIVINFRNTGFNLHKKRMNFYGAISVIMQDYVDEFIQFLSQKVHTDFFSNSYIRENFKFFSFSSMHMTREGKIPGGVLTESYEEVFKKNPMWIDIAELIIEKVYGGDQDTGEPIRGQSGDREDQSGDGSMIEP